MNTILIVLALLCVAVGLLGSLLPALPGPPLSIVGMLLLSFTSQSEITINTIVLFGIVAVAITVLDYVIPSWTTKRFGGTKAGVWGCNIGLVVAVLGLPIVPIVLPSALGIIVWPFVGAFVGELINHQPSDKALRAAFGAFVGFLSGTFIKVVYGIVVAIVVVKDLLS